MLKELGTSSMKANAAIDSLAKTDDMLAIIGIIMLAGVIVSSYGAYWQGKYAKASYKKECTPDNQAYTEKLRQTNYIYLGVIIFLVLAGVIIFIFKRKPKAVTA